MIEATAPVRICDNGGWTDTWFGGPGRVVNVAVNPGVMISIAPATGPERVTLNVEAFGDRYHVAPGATRVARHPLLEAAIDELPPPDEQAMEITVGSVVPAGCGAGTSASVAVALLGALAAARGEALTPRDAAYAAHRLEVEVLGVESGIQDQLSAAFGGINYLEIEPYPEATVQRLPEWGDFGARLSLVFLGRPHDSSGLHVQVIEQVMRQPSDAFSQLRDAAVAARVAASAGDLEGFGRAMIANTDAQRALHPALVGADAGRVIETAGAGGAIGWKVNGAGGDGGSLTLLSATPEGKRRLDARIAELRPGYRVIPISISADGLVVTGGL